MALTIQVSCKFDKFSLSWAWPMKNYAELSWSDFSPFFLLSLDLRFRNQSLTCCSERPVLFATSEQRVVSRAIYWFFENSDMRISNWPWVNPCFPFTVFTEPSFIFRRIFCAKDIFKDLMSYSLFTKCIALNFIWGWRWRSINQSLLKYAHSEHEWEPEKTSIFDEQGVFSWQSLDYRDGGNHFFWRTSGVSQPLGVSSISQYFLREICAM